VRYDKWIFGELFSIVDRIWYKNNQICVDSSRKEREKTLSGRFGCPLIGRRIATRPISSTASRPTRRIMEKNEQNKIQDNNHTQVKNNSR
jgi:hypothetical protein